jgi:hypothetical protein
MLIFPVDQLSATPHLCLSTDEMQRESKKSGEQAFFLENLILKGPSHEMNLAFDDIYESDRPK